MIKSSRFVNQAVLVGNERKFPAALIVPNFEMLESYAKLKELDIKTPAEFCHHPTDQESFHTPDRSNDTTGLAQFEKVKKFALIENELTVENGELTPTLKVKRRVVDQKYGPDRRNVRLIKHANQYTIRVPIPPVHCPRRCRPAPITNSKTSEQCFFSPYRPQRCRMARA